jgi:hypothetical protein
MASSMAGGGLVLPPVGAPMVPQTSSSRTVVLTGSVEGVSCYDTTITSCQQQIANIEYSTTFKREYLPLVWCLLTP